MSIWDFNRGEWTEAYVFLYLLGSGRLYGANENQLRNDLTYIDIVNIIRDEPDSLIIFERYLEEEQVKISFENEGVIRFLTAPELTAKASLLYEKIRTVSAGNRKLQVPEIQDFLERMFIKSPKANLSSRAKEQYGAKADIIITSEDSQDRARRTEGFSIKSHLGSSPSLFNGSQTSGFVYEIPECTESLMHAINALDSFTDMIAYIRQNLSLKFCGCRNEVFAENLELSDGSLENVLNELVLSAINYNEGALSKSLTDLCDALACSNPLGKRHPEYYYSSKIKKFLFDSFAGMTATSTWNGRRNLTGGYIDVNKDGEMLYYRANSDDVFCNYLMKYAYLDFLDRGRFKDVAVAKAIAYNEHREITEDELHEATFKSDGKKKDVKGNHGYVYERNGQFYIDINFQVRCR